VADLTVDKLLEDAMARRAAQLEEYGKWVATEQIVFGNAVAFNEGDAVPVGHVERFSLEEKGLVKLRTPEDTGSIPVVESVGALEDALTPPEQPAAKKAASKTKEG
jgi:hypothetical protein